MIARVPDMSRKSVNIQIGDHDFVMLRYADRVAKHYGNYNFLSADDEFEMLMSRDVLANFQRVVNVSITRKYLRTCVLSEIVSILFISKHRDRGMTSS